MVGTLKYLIVMTFGPAAVQRKGSRMSCSVSRRMKFRQGARQRVAAVFGEVGGLNPQFKTFRVGLDELYTQVGKNILRRVRVVKLLLVQVVKLLLLGDV